MDAEGTDEQDGFARAVAAVRAGASVEEQARSLYRELTDEERLWILDGDTPFWSGLADMMSGGFNEHTFIHGGIGRLGIPGLRFCDGPRGVAPAFPYGFGLSYTTFSIDSASCEAWAGDDAALSVTGVGDGDRDGRHVVQVYGRRGSSEHAHETWLLGFLPVDVPARATVTISVPFSLEPLALWSDEARFRVPADRATVTVEVGAHARDPHALAVDLAPAPLTP